MNSLDNPRILTERPTTVYCSLLRLGTIALYPFVRPILLGRRRRAKKRLDGLLMDARQYRKRDELEIILGKTKYTMLGSLYKRDIDSGLTLVPDFVDVYEVRGASIEAWIRDGKIVAITGFLRPTIWDAADRWYTQRRRE